MHPVILWLVLTLKKEQVLILFSADKRFFNNVCEDQQLIKAENELYVKDDHELSPMCTDHKVKGLVAENHVEKKDKRKSINAKSLLDLQEDYLWMLLTRSLSKKYLKSH